MRKIIGLGVLVATATLVACGGTVGQSSYRTPELKKLTGDNESDGKEVTVTSEMALRTLQGEVLELAAKLPKGSILEVSPNSEVVNYKYRNEKGELVFSSTGFIGGIVIKSSSLSQKEINQLNSLATGLYVSATITDQLQTGLEFLALSPGTAAQGYIDNYETTGRPKIRFTESITKRWPNTLNKKVSLSSTEKRKWNAIMTELQRVADRTRSVDKSFFMIDPEIAHEQSIEFEKSGKVQEKGAWSIAVLGTATRHGFQNVPCAEFMSEVLRQAYRRAGYSHFDDFNEKNENVLMYQGGAALVTNFSDYLNKAGFIPWDPQVYIPPTGAFVMHRSGKSPGHTYMAAGDNGRFIFDNGSPQGRDLRITTKKTIELMYNEGVFFLPPGYVPKKW
jgi:hypothetical protein